MGRKKLTEDEIQGLFDGQAPVRVTFAPMWVIALGDPFNGMRIKGPFDDYAHAVDYAQTYYFTETWHVVEVKVPEDD